MECEGSKMTDYSKFDLTINSDSFENFKYQTNKVARKTKTIFY